MENQKFIVKRKNKIFYRPKGNKNESSHFIIQNYKEKSLYEIDCDFSVKIVLRPDGQWTVQKLWYSQHIWNGELGNKFRQHGVHYVETYWSDAYERMKKILANTVGVNVEQLIFE